MKLQAFNLNFFKKETPRQVLSCEVCGTFKNNYFEEHLQTTLLVVLYKKVVRKNFAISTGQK